MLLAALPTSDFERLAPQFETVDVDVGTVLYESGEKLEYLYFPATTIVSVLHVTKNGESTEVAVIGFEGAVGVVLFIGGMPANRYAVVQSAGQAFRLPRTVLDEEFWRCGPLQWMLLRYTTALITQMAQTAVCNRHHSLEQQLCRWLLIRHDRWGNDTLRMTQQTIADMLGVRREGVTEAAQRLQASGAIRYSRGAITIVDRAFLEAHTCECYEVVNTAYTRLLRDVQIPHARRVVTRE